MTEERSFVHQVAARSEQEPDVVSRVIAEFCLALRRQLDGYKGTNGDYIGEQLRWDIGDRGFFHLLGFLDQLYERYQWEPGLAREYVARLFTEDDCKHFSQEYVVAKTTERTDAGPLASRTLEEFCSAAYACAMTLMSNADYVHKELPAVDLPSDVRASVVSHCADWIGTKHDVVHELDELKESSDIEAGVRRIMRWLGEDMVRLQEQVRQLEALATSEDRYRRALMLVGESCANVLTSFIAVGEAADRLLESL